MERCCHSEDRLERPPRARRFKAACKSVAVTVAMFCAVSSHANLIPEFYVFEDRPEPVGLALGSVLFHFYQEEHRQTLTESLYVEERFGTAIEGKDSLLLARGSAAIELGLLDPAKQWLQNVDQSRLPVEAIPRLNLALARVAFLDGRDAEAEQYLSQLDESTANDARVAYLRAELRRRAGDLEGMKNALAALPEQSRLWFFGWHNYAVTAYGMQDVARAAVAFDELVRAKPDNRHERDIVIRAGLQTAMLRLQNEDLEGAIAQLDVLPVRGTYGRTALGQRANLALEHKDYLTAARAYGLLATDDSPWDAQRLSGLVGVAHALEAAGKREQALARYETASSHLKQRAELLRDLTDRIRGDRAWLQAAADVGDGNSMELLKSIDEGFAGIDWLSWLSDRQTQRQLASWQNLHGLNQRLRVLSASTDALAEVAVERDRRVALAAQQITAAGVGDQVAATRDRLAQLANDLAELRVQPDAGLLMTSLATADEVATWQKLVALEGQLKSLEGAAGAVQNGKLSVARQRLARLQGRLTYEVATNRAERIWAIEKDRRAALTRLLALELRVERLQGAENDRAAQAGALGLVERYRTQLKQLALRAEELTRAREEGLVTSLIAQVQQDQEATDKHLAFARLALARLSDQMMMAQGGETP